MSKPIPADTENPLQPHLSSVSSVPTILYYSGIVDFGGWIQHPRSIIVSHSISSNRNAFAFLMFSSRPGVIQQEQAAMLYVQVRFLHINTKGDNSIREMRLRERIEISVSARY